MVSTKQKLLYIAAMLLISAMANANEHYKCTQQVINPYKGRAMSAGNGAKWFKRDSKGNLVESNEFEFTKEAYSQLNSLKK